MCREQILKVIRSLTGMDQVLIIISVLFILVSSGNEISVIPHLHVFGY